MGISKHVLFALLILMNVYLFQNCVGSRFAPLNHNSFSNATQSFSNGQPYDGKIYINAGSGCPDGTFVQSRVILKNTTAATVVRENCQNVSRDLGAAEFLVDPVDPDKLQYNNQAFTTEKPSTLIPILSMWYYQLTGTLQSHNSLVYDIDMFDNSMTDIQALKQAGHIVICNISAGTSESWRPDAGSFAGSDLGNNVSGMPNETWVDTRSSSVRSIMVARMDLAKSKGCDGIDLDSVDGYANNTGFPLTTVSQIDYNQFLAFAAHDRYLVVDLKNTADLADSLVNAYDFAIADQCFQYNECSKYQSFTTQGKAILAAEFTPMSTAQCSTARSLSLSLAYFNTALDGSGYVPCP